MSIISGYIEAAKQVWAAHKGNYIGEKAQYDSYVSRYSEIGHTFTGESPATPLRRMFSVQSLRDIKAVRDVDAGIATYNWRSNRVERLER